MKCKLGFVLFLCSLLLFGCGKKVDDEALTNLSDSLVKRWEYADTLPKEVSKEELLNVIQTELDTLQKFDINDFKNPLLYGYLSSYKSELEIAKTKAERLVFRSDEFDREWNEHLERRAKTLYDINEKFKVDVPDKYTEHFEGVLANADRLVEIETMKNILSEIKKWDDLKVEIEDNSIAVSYKTESALSTNSFVAHKTGFPSSAMDILEKLSNRDYDEVVVATINNESVAASVLFEKDSLKRIDYDKWDKLDSVDAYKIYSMSDAYHIRSGIWADVDSETKDLIGDMNKQSSNEFWSYYGFSR